MLWRKCVEAQLTLRALLNLYTLDLASTGILWCLLLILILNLLDAKWLFANHTIPSTFMNWIFSVRKSFLFFPIHLLTVLCMCLYVHSFTHPSISGCTHGCLFFFQWFVLLLSLFILMFKWPDIWLVGAPCHWLLCPMDMYLSLFAHFLNF